jgi:hypothetical protein
LIAAAVTSSVQQQQQQTKKQNNNNNQNQNKNSSFPRYLSSLWRIGDQGEFLRSGKWLSTDSSSSSTASIALRNYILSLKNNNNDQSCSNSNVPMYIWSSLRITGLP